MGVRGSPEARLRLAFFGSTGTAELAAARDTTRDRGAEAERTTKEAQGARADIATVVCVCVCVCGMMMNRWSADADVCEQKVHLKDLGDLFFLDVQIFTG